MFASEINDLVELQIRLQKVRNNDNNNDDSRIRPRTASVVEAQARAAKEALKERE